MLINVKLIDDTSIVQEDITIYQRIAKRVTPCFCVIQSLNSVKLVQYKIIQIMKKINKKIKKKRKEKFKKQMKTGTKTQIIKEKVRERERGREEERPKIIHLRQLCCKGFN